MDITGVTDAMNSRLGAMRHELDLLEEALKNTAFAYWVCDDTTYRDKAAIDRIMSALRTWWYVADAPVPQYGLVVADDNARSIIEQINHIKTEFQELHESVKLFATDSSHHTKLLSDIKKHLTIIEGPANLDAVDRKIPLVSYPVIRATWYEEKSKSSTPRPVADAIAEITLIMSDIQSELVIERLTKDVDYLKTLPADTMLSHQPKRQVRGQYCVLNGVEPYSGERIEPYKCWGVNPVFVGDSPMLIPQVLWHTPTKRPNVKNNQQTQQKPICASLPHWFPYLKKIQATVEPKVKSAKSGNPYSRTAYPGMWIGLRMRAGTREASIRFTRENMADSAVSLKKHTLDKAWEIAAHKHVTSFDDIDTVPPIETILALAPPEQQLKNAIEWFDANNKTKPLDTPTTEQDEPAQKSRIKNAHNFYVVAR